MCFYLWERFKSKNLIIHSRDSSFPIKISLIICNNKKANGINYAKKFKIPYIFINTGISNYDNKFCLILKNIRFLLFALRVI